MNRRDKDYEEMETFDLDADPMNANWPKRTWELPPYKSEAFMKFLERSGTTLEQFRKRPIYLFAVEQGVIVDDEWVGPMRRSD